MRNLVRCVKNNLPLPNQIHLFPHQETCFVARWHESLCEAVDASGNLQPVREHGVALIEVPGDNLDVGQSRPGKEDGFPLDATEWSRNDFWGYYHTHPYSDGTVGVAFSFGDFRALIRLGMRLCLAQSGRDIFMLVRTEQTPECLPSICTEAHFMALVAKYEKETGGWQMGILKANQEYAERLNLALYYGAFSLTFMSDVGGIGL